MASAWTTCQPTMLLSLTPPTSHQPPAKVHLQPAATMPGISTASPHGWHRDPSTMAPSSVQLAELLYNTPVVSQPPLLLPPPTPSEKNWLDGRVRVFIGTAREMAREHTQPLSSPQQVDTTFFGTFLVSVLEDLMLYIDEMLISERRVADGVVDGDADDAVTQGNGNGEEADGSGEVSDMD